MTRVPRPGPAARLHGPYGTEREAAKAARIGVELRPGWSILSSDQNRQMLTGACEAAGVGLGAFDERIVAWLAGFEDSTCAVIAGLIARAGTVRQRPARRDRHPRLSDAETRTVLDALDVAADYKRDRAEACSDCDARPDGALCPACESRLAQADEYDALAEELRTGGAS